MASNTGSKQISDTEKERIAGTGTRNTLANYQISNRDVKENLVEDVADRYKMVHEEAISKELLELNRGDK